MLIKEVELENIRSYVGPTRIEFGPGITLIEGDIGSGKSSILMAIEFALFGSTGSEFYERLLRKDATKGRVRLRFEVNGKVYEVERSLKRTKSGIRAERCYLTEGDARVPLSPTQLRRHIMSILGIKSEGRRSVPVFQYAFYTPQETMKMILEESEDVRVEMIKKVFRLDEYRIVMENAEAVVDRLKSECRGLRGMAEGLEEKRERAKELERAIEEQRRTLEDVRKHVNTLSGKLSDLAKKKEELERRREKIERLERHLVEVRSKINALEERKAYLEGELREAEDAIAKARRLEPRVRELERLQGEVERMEALLRERMNLEALLREIAVQEGEIEKRLGEMEALEKEMEVLEKRLEERRKALEEYAGLDERIEEFQNRLNDVRGRIMALRQKLVEMEAEYREISALSGKKECPKCRQPLTGKHLKELQQSYEREIKRVKKEIEEESALEKVLTKKLKDMVKKRGERDRMDREIARLEEKMAAYRERLAGRGELESRLKKLREERRQKERKLKEMDSTSPDKISDMRKKIRELEGIRDEYLRLQTIARGAKNKEENLKRVMKELAILREEEKRLTETLDGERKEFSEEDYRHVKMEYEKTLRELSGEERRGAEMERFIARLEEDLRILREEIMEKERALNQLERFQALIEWINNAFIPAMRRLEEVRTEWLRHAFNELFQSWVSELLQETEYEARIDEDFSPVVTMEDYEMPMNTLSGGERTSIALAYRLALNTLVKEALRLKSHLLILDEPTEGFSKDQLHKLKDVFERVKAQQVIIVSHERELENLADRIYLVSKSGGVSSVEVIG